MNNKETPDENLIEDDGEVAVHETEALKEAVERLEAIVQEFNLNVIDKHFDQPIPKIIVDSGDGSGERVIVGASLRGRIAATGKIKGVPMKFYGNGQWIYSIDV